MLESDTGIHNFFYDLKPSAPGKKVKRPNGRGMHYFVQSTPQESKHLLKAGSLILYKV